MVNWLRIFRELTISNIFIRLQYFIHFLKLLITFSIEFTKIYNYFHYSLKPYVGSNNERLSIIQLYLHIALNSIFKACKLTINGYPIEAQHNNRIIVESVSVACLCSRKKINVYNDIANSIRSKSKYKFNKVFDKLCENSKILNLDQNGIDIMKKNYEFTHGFSHATTKLIGHVRNYSKKMSYNIGQFYDKTKNDIYKYQLLLQISASKVLMKGVIDVIMHNLKSDKLI